MHFLSHYVSAYTTTWEKKNWIFAKVLEYFEKEFSVLQEKLPFQEKTPIVSFSSLCGSSSDQLNPPDNHYHHLPDKR